MMLASIALAMYANVHDAFSLAGHACKVTGFYVAYRMVFVASVREPYERLADETAARERAQRSAWRLQYIDPLTGLPNRARLQDRLAARFPRPPALLLVDLDGFSAINDVNGHGFGDAVLRMVGERLALHAPRTGEVFRLGGDEFAVLLEDPAGPAAARALGEQLAAAVAAPMRTLDRDIVLTASVGIATAPDGAGGEALVRNASTALHRAKDAGPGSCRLHDVAMDIEISERMSLRADLRLALERGEMRVHYQPQLELATGRVTGAEALVRWEHPTRGTIGPSRFIGEAEESGQIVALGDWVLRESCRQAAAWRREGLELDAVSVNFSARQFQDEDVAARVALALEATGLPASALEIELTESVLIHDTEAMLAALRSLKALGVRIAIDDFGTGYSSLAYLHAFPLDRLKIDQSFVRELGRRSDSQVVVRGIVQLAGALSLETVAEGVEDAAAASLLEGMGCQRAQGYHFARPLRAPDFAAFARASRLPLVAAVVDAAQGA
jgi:diguanylate cyclase